MVCRVRHGGGSLPPHCYVFDLPACGVLNFLCNCWIWRMTIILHLKEDLATFPEKGRDEDVPEFSCCFTVYHTVLFATPNFRATYVGDRVSL